MEIVVGIVIGIALGVIGFIVGRSSGRGAGIVEGRARGLEEGRTKGLEEGRHLGRAEGVEQGRTQGAEAGRAKGLEEGRRAGSAGAAQQAREQADRRIRAFAEALARGGLPEGAEIDSAEAALLEALQSGWAPRESERDEALREAVGRVSRFLATNVRAPLAGAADDAEPAELKERIERAVGALQDLDFYLEEPSTEHEGRDLVPLIRQVTSEFAADHDVGLRLQLAGASVRASVNPQTLMDGLYLILHNAARFGGGATVDVVLDTEGGTSRILIRDRGPGFTEEDFKRAFDPFYSTSNEGLGLGLPHARKLIERMGGKIALANVPDGGAQVEISFPSA